MFLQSRSISAVLPEPTGPPMPTRKGPWDLGIVILHRRPGQASVSERDPGPITTKDNCSATLELQLRITTTFVVMGPGVRRDDSGACVEQLMRLTGSRSSG